jgi:hypothetical protein
VQTKTDRKTIAIVVLVATFAAAYFLLTFNRTLILADEGYLLYNCAKTAAGQVPHRDFYDDYGPALYWVGAALFNLFGTKIIVTRVFLLILKTLMAVLVFLIGKRILPSIFALAGSLLFVLNWGDPLIGPVNVFYAGHFSHFLALLGVLFMMQYIDTENRAWLLGTGVCVGFSMLFKFPTAVIDFLGFALFLCFREHQKSLHASGIGSLNAHPRLQTLQGLRGLKLIGVGGTAIFYFVYLAGAHLALSTFFLLLFPLFLVLGRLLLLEYQGLRGMREQTGSLHWESLKSIYAELAIMLAAPMILIAIIVALYVNWNGFSDLVYDTFVLPSYLKFHLPLADQGILAALAAGLILVILPVAAIGKRLVEKGMIPRAIYAGALSAILVMLPIIGFTMEVSYRVWHRLATFLLLPLALLVGTILFLLRLSRQRKAGGGDNELLALGLIVIFACQSTLMIFMRPDEIHVVVNSTIIFVLAAFILHELHQGLKRLLPEFKLAPAFAPVLACMALVSIPYLWGMKILYFPPSSQNAQNTSEHESIRSYPMLILDAPRAQGLKLPVSGSFTPPLMHPMAVDMNDVVNFIREHTSPEERIFLTCGDQIIYFLSERESILQKENYFAYLSNVELIDRTYTGKVSDEEILEIVASSKPRFIIKTPKYADTVHFGLTWPKTNAFINAGYEIDTIFGEYHILRRRGSLPS